MITDGRINELEFQNFIEKYEISVEFKNLEKSLETAESTYLNLKKLVNKLNKVGGK